MVKSLFKIKVFLSLLIFSFTLFANSLQKPTDIQEKIMTLCKERVRAPGDFKVFANALASLGVSRQTYDVIDDTLYFYSKDRLLLKVPFVKIQPSSGKSHFVIGDALNEKKVKTAIAQFDHNKTSVLAFHREIAKAGVVFVNVYLNKGVIYYSGQDGKNFVETI